MPHLGRSPASCFQSWWQESEYARFPKMSTVSEDITETLTSKKPLMVIHHRDNCPHSQALKKAFVADKSIQKMAEKDFVMMNLIVDTKDKNLAPDGHYVPRILFVDPSLTVRTEIVGRFKSHLYTYEPADMTLLAENMKKAKRMKKTEL